MSARSRLLVPVVFLSVALVLTACGGGGATKGFDTPPGSVVLAASYSGTETVEGLSGPVSVSLSQNGNQVTGHWGNQFGGLINLGTLSGTLNGNSLTATLTSGIAGECSNTVTATLSGTSITGTFSTVPGCPAPQSGTFTLHAGSSLPNLGGSASGTLNDSLMGPGTISGTITQSGVILVGTYSDSFAETGQFYGLVVGSTVYFDLVPSDPMACPVSASGTLVGNTVTGNYTALFCTVADMGTFSITL